MSKTKQITSTPERIFPAFNTSIIKVTGENITIQPKYPNEDIPPVVIGVSTGALNEYEGDISKIMKRLFRNTTQAIEAEGVSAYRDFNLRADAEIINIGYYVALNAVRQFGEQFPQGPYIASTLPIIKYAGYPLSIAITGKATDSDDKTFIPVTLSLDGKKLSITEPHFVIDVPEGAQSIGIDGTAQRADIVQGCIGDQPFYIRWINTQGGYDYYMFNARKQYETERADTVNIQRADVTDENDTQASASFSIERRVTTGMDNLPADAYAKLLGVIKAPRIEWWNEQNSRWVALVTDNVSNTWDTNSGLGSIELTFIFPRTLLQQ